MTLFATLLKVFDKMCSCNSQPFSEQNSASHKKKKKMKRNKESLSVLIYYDMSLPRLVPNVPAIKQWPKLFKATVSSKSAIRLNLVSVSTAGKISHSN